MSLRTETVSDSLTDEQQIYLWIRGNRGVCSQIAKDFGVSREFVRQILYFPRVKSADRRIERALADAGAPFMQERVGVAA